MERNALREDTSAKTGVKTACDEWSRKSVYDRERGDEEGIMKIELEGGSR